MSQEKDWSRLACARPSISESGRSLAGKTIKRTAARWSRGQEACRIREELGRLDRDSGGSWIESSKASGSWTKTIWPRPWSDRAPRKQCSGEHIEGGGFDATHHIEPSC